MKARVLVSFFSEEVSGTADTVIDIPNQKTFDELVKAGYIEPMESNKKEKENINSDPEQLYLKKQRASKVDDSK